LGGGQAGQEAVKKFSELPLFQFSSRLILGDGRGAAKDKIPVLADQLCIVFFLSTGGSLTP